MLLTNLKKMVASKKEERQTYADQVITKPLCTSMLLTKSVDDGCE
jgi:hypothetical protein